MKEYSGFKKAILYILKWLALGLLMGVTSGGVGALLAKAVSFVTTLRGSYSSLLFLLPIGGIVSVFLYKRLKTEQMNTELIIEGLYSEKQVSARIIPAIFSATVISQTFGASAGKEGAALQLGGGFAALFRKLFKLEIRDARILTVCGMGGFFAALFGAPLGTCIFAVEVAVIGKMYLSALFPALVSCFAAAEISGALGVQAERFNIPYLPDFTFNTVIKVIAISVCALIVSIVFCKLLAFCEENFPRIIKNAYLRIIIGSAVIIILTVLLDTTDYNGAGSHVIHRIMEGERVSNYAFLLKMIFTIVSVSCGFKGGEIVPTLFIGSALGSLLAPIFGLPIVFGAALGMISLFCGATKCPVASFVLASEMFGGRGIVFFLICVIFSFLPIHKTGLYQSQKFILRKRA